LTSDREHDEIRIEAIGFIGDQAPDACKPPIIGRAVAGVRRSIHVNGADN
jgi:hypothetical protein